MATESRILDLLDSWRELPAYQLERRADVFFAAYLPQFLSHKFCKPVSEILIPEFPFHLKSLYPDKPRKKDDSCRLDYLALSVDLADAYFIELKTDLRSVGKPQKQRMADAKAAGFQALLEGVKKIVGACTNTTADSTSLQKYCCLLKLLEKNSLISLPENLVRHFA